MTVGRPRAAVPRFAGDSNELGWAGAGVIADVVSAGGGLALTMGASGHYVLGTGDLIGVGWLGGSARIVSHVKLVGELVAMSDLGPAAAGGVRFFGQTVAVDLSGAATMLGFTPWLVVSVRI